MPATPDMRMSELFDQAVETFGGAMRAGARLQEDMQQWWNDAMGHMGAMQEWQRKSSAVLTEAIPTVQRAADEYMRVMDQSYHSGLDLLKRALDSGRAETMSEQQARTQDLWESGLEVARNNAQAMAQANVRIMESWADFLKKNVEVGQQQAARQTSRATKK